MRSIYLKNALTDLVYDNGLRDFDELDDETLRELALGWYQNEATHQDKLDAILYSPTDLTRDVDLYLGLDDECAELASYPDMAVEVVNGMLDNITKFCYPLIQEAFEDVVSTARLSESYDRYEED